MSFNETQILVRQKSLVRRHARAAANRLAAKARKDLTVDRNGVPSVPGEFPTTQSGELKGSVTVQETTVGRDEVEFRIEVEAPYAEPLVNRGRLLLASFLRQLGGDVRRILAGK